ncbi:MAG: hypothetical protein ABDK94_01800 [Atribacterota bacterium]
MVKAFLMLMVFAATLHFAFPVFAHQPFWNPGSSTMERAYRIADPSVSQAIFGQLRSGERDFFLVEMTTESLLQVSLFVGEGCGETFRPKLWLVGENIEGNSLPFLPEGMGAQKIEGTWRPFRGHGLRAFKGPELRRRISPGRVYLVVEGTDAAGFYLLSINGREVPGGSPEGWQAIPKFNQCRE